ncbi:MAG: class I SAM-dependent RNA methyltransferase [Clostridiales bacterium]|nr:class I SAM-dependent RNA methyltransferase [Clostridiales bacterium]
MEKGQVFEFKIEDMSAEGQGIGRAEGLVVFVPGGVIGDVVSVELTKVKKSYAFSKLLRIIEYSPHRDAAFECEFFDSGCGGCPFGGIDYMAQTAMKERQVNEKLKRLAGLEQPLVRPIITMEETDNDSLGAYRYRNKATFPVSTGGIITRKGGIVENLGEPAVGFYRAKSHEVVDCEDCLLQSFPAMAAADALRRFMEEDNITAWDPKWEKGLLRHLIVKTAFTTKEVMVILVVNGKGIPNMAKLVEMLDDAIYDVGYSLESVIINVNKKPKPAKDSAMGDENIVAAGKPVIVDKIGDLQFEISPGSFYQVNPVQVKRLYDKVREYCLMGDDEEQENSQAAGEAIGNGEAAQGNAWSGKPAEDPADHVILDLYCGVGTIGLYCADIAESVIGIESVKDAVLDANRNSVINGIVNARYICSRAEEELPKHISAGKTAGKAHRTTDTDTGKEAAGKVEALDISNADIAILDPPRAGCRPELLEAVAGLGIERIVYVSCDPATLARDIKLLIELGYEFKEATPVDMFPWTGHVECVVLMSRVEK